MTVAAGSSEEEVDRAASGSERIAEWLARGSVVKRIYVPGKLLNIVVK